MSSGFEGWLYGVGRIDWWGRGLLLIAAFGLLKPGLYTDLFGVGALVVVYGFHLLLRRRPATGSTASL